MTQAAYKFEQIHQVRTGLWDGDSFGHEWQIYLTAYETDSGFELYKDDGRGNGDFFASTYTRGNAIELMSAYARANPA
jgi:hypothetical protein